MKVRKLKVKGKCFGCGRNHQKDKGRCQAKAAECHKFGKYDYFTRVCLSAISGTRSRSGQGKQSCDHQARHLHHRHQHHLNSRYHRTNTKYCGKHHGSKRVQEIQEPSSSESDFSDKCSTYLFSDTKDKRYLVDQLTFVIESIQVNQIIHGSEVYVDLQTPKTAICSEAKVDTGTKGNVMPILVYENLFRTKRPNHPVTDFKAMAVSYCTIKVSIPWGAKPLYLSHRSWISISLEKAAFPPLV